MNTNVTKSYTNSELFTFANKIRRESGCTKSEAYHKAKEQLEKKNDKTFDLAKALKGADVKTKSGKRAKVICETRGKILVQVYSNLGFYLDQQIKYNLDGSRWSPRNPDIEDLEMA